MDMSTQITIGIHSPHQPLTSTLTDLEKITASTPTDFKIYTSTLNGRAGHENSIGQAHTLLLVLSYVFQMEFR